MQHANSKSDCLLLTPSEIPLRWSGDGTKEGKGEGVVLRISVDENPGALSLIVEGRLVGPWVDELQRLCQERGAPGSGSATTIDLCGVTAMDARGQALLDDLFRRGATLRCSDVMNQYLVEQIARPAERFLELCRPCRGSQPPASAATANRADGTSLLAS